MQGLTTQSRKQHSCPVPHGPAPHETVPSPAMSGQHPMPVPSRQHSADGAAAQTLNSATKQHCSFSLWEFYLPELLLNNRTSQCEVEMFMLYIQNNFYDHAVIRRKLELHMHSIVPTPTLSVPAVGQVGECRLQASVNVTCPSNYILSGISSEFCAWAFTQPHGASLQTQL